LELEEDDDDDDDDDEEADTPSLLIKPAFCNCASTSISNETSHESNIRSSSMDSVQLRYACDRCRGHKLRCERKDFRPGTDKCERCTKARVNCVTSPPLRMGRPRHKTPSSTSLGAAFSDTVDLDLLLNTSSSHSPLHPAFQPQHIAVCSSSSTSLSPLVTPPPTSDPSYSSDGKDKLQSANALFDYDWGSEHMFVDPSLFRDFRDDYHGTETQTSNPAALKNEYLEKLANLSSALFKQLNLINSNQAAQSSYFPSPSLSSATSNLENVPHSEVTPNGSRYPIGPILESSQKFLGILKYFLLSSSIRPPSSQKSRSETTDSDREREDETSNTKATSGSANPHQPSSNPPSLRPGPAPTVLSHSTLPDFPGLRDPSMSAKPGPHHLDLPTILSILTCYVSLIRVYRSILTQIYNVLQTSNPPSPLGLPPILPGLSLDGFNLEHHYSLQINILTQVSMDLLQRIEKAVAALAGGETVGDAAGAFGLTGGYTSLLEMVVRQEALKEGQGEQGSMESLRLLVKKIKRSLEENVCLQMEEAEVPA
ncbi:MAG: hypothetical protein LQ347_005649, partial [Umbilicaria vellea]